MSAAPATGALLVSLRCAESKAEHSVKDTATVNHSAGVLFMGLTEQSNQTAYFPALPSLTSRKPTWSLPLLTSPRPRVPTM